MLRDRSGFAGEGEWAARQILAEVSSPMADLVVAYRDAGRFVQSIEPVRCRPPEKDCLSGGTGFT